MHLTHSSGLDRTRVTAAVGYFQQSSAARSDAPDAVVWNATSHADPHIHGCPSAPAMQHAGGADVALHR
jgi:hypothetical protein